MSTAAKSTPRKAKKRPKSPDGTMPILDHLMELRHRLMVALLWIALGTILGYVWYEHSIPALHVRGYTVFPHIESLGEILKAPYCSLPDSARASLTADGECKLLATSPFEMFMLRFKVGSIAGIVLASPFWLLQIWKFITPGLLKNERRWAISISTIAGFLFILGAVIAYLVLDVGLSMLLSLGDSTQTAALTGHDYFSFVLGLIFIFGLSFEMPLFTAMLNMAGVLHYEHIKGKRSIFIVVLFFFAAIATPGQDPVSMTVLAIALCLLMELAFQFTRIRDKRAEKNRPEWANVDDEKASDLDYTAEPIDSATTLGTGDRMASAPVEAPQPVARPQDLAGGTPFDDVL